MRFFTILCLFLCTVLVHSGELRLFNNSDSPLNVVIRDATGQVVAQYLVNPQETKIWSEWSQSESAPSTSETPYTATWFCLNGSQFSFCEDIAEGAFVSAMDCQGNYDCGSSQNSSSQQGSN